MLFVLVNKKLSGRTRLQIILILLSVLKSDPNIFCGDGTAVQVVRVCVYVPDGCSYLLLYFQEKY